MTDEEIEIFLVKGKHQSPNLFWMILYRMETYKNAEK